MSSRGCRSRWNIGATAGTVLEGGGDLPVIGEYWLNGVMDEEFKTVAETVERTFREALGNDLILGDLDPRMQFIDSKNPYSLDVEEFPNMEAMGDSPFRMLIENRDFQSTKLGKVNMELCCRKDGLQIIHFIMMPRREYNLPILGMDMVGVHKVSFAIVDLVPASMKSVLPPEMDEVLERKAPVPMESTGKMPDWFLDFASPRCLSAAVTGPDKFEMCFEYIQQLLQVYLQFVNTAKPVPDDCREDIYSAHNRFMNNNLENVKTRSALQASFGKEFAIDYMQNVMFKLE